jgi:hypothetical protein
LKCELILKRVFEKGYIKFELPYEDYLRNKLTYVLGECKEKHGDFVKITLEAPCRKRTLTQNAKLHAMISELADFTGDEFEHLKYELKVLAIRRGYPVKTNNRGDPMFSEIDGRPIPKSTAEVTSQELSYLIEEIRQQAAEMGVYLNE